MYICIHVYMHICIYVYTYIDINIYNTFAHALYPITSVQQTLRFNAG